MRSFLLSLFLFFLPWNLNAELTEEVIQEMVQMGAFLGRAGLCPATSGSISQKLNDRLIAITASGVDKGNLSLEDILLVDLNGNPYRSKKKPSAETLMHTAVYAACPNAQVAIHTHSLHGSLLSRLLHPEKMLITQGYEIHKAFPHITTHESEVFIPIFENTQNVAALSEEVCSYLKEHPNVFGFLIRGHGFYTWGQDMSEAKKQIEAFEFLFESEFKYLLIPVQN